MTVTVTLSNVSNLQNWYTASSTIDSNSASITTGFDSCLNASGDTMTGNLNMNGNQILNLGATSYTVSTLPASPTKGQQAVVTDGVSGASWGSTPTGGSSTTYLVWYNGTAWTVIGK